MKRFYIVTMVMFLLLVLFYVYGLSIEKYDTVSYPVAVEAGARLP